MVSRLILWVSLAGMILALHLWVQKARGFDQGCLGLNSHAGAMVKSGCHEVSELPASHLLGVSNAAWGYAFYFGIALLAFGKILARPAVARRLHAASEVGVAAGFLYSVYLVVQMATVAHAWCALCLVSAALVTLLLLLHLSLRLRGGFQPVAEAARATEIGLAVGGLFLMSGLLVGVLVFVNRLGTRSLTEGQAGRDLKVFVGAVLPSFIDETKLAEMRACRFEWSAPALDLGKFVSSETPFIGDAAALRVVLFVDPNCPHCRDYFPEFMAAAEKQQGRAGFTVVPRVLWPESIPQACALKLAEGSGKYFDLWRMMFARQPGPRKGMDAEQIAALFRELGLDATDLPARLAAVRPAVEAQTEAFRRSGVTYVPAVFFEGRQVWSENQGADCLGRLVERVRAGAVKLR